MLLCWQFDTRHSQAAARVTRWSLARHEQTAQMPFRLAVVWKLTAAGHGGDVNVLADECVVNAWVHAVPGHSPSSLDVGALHHHELGTHTP